VTLSPGNRLGPYEILAAIGAGGMGEVYKARDTRLDRSVAIKVLPPEVSGEPDRRARFEREARTIAGLNHPHICTLHDVGETNGTTYLVMEHLTGETLAARLEKDPLPLEQALTVATEIADALAAAHRQGVIHRDLKPANVMLTKSGAKLLDFGLAKLAGHGEQAAAASLASAPTRTAPLTSEGKIVGTLQYMAPEQIEGKTADARTDLWALGAILYEMLAGKRPFEGAGAASLIGAILEREPAPLPTFQPLTPPAVDRLVRQCLAKAPEDRPDTAHDVANDLRWLRDASGVAASTTTQSRGGRAARTTLWVGAVLVAAVLGAGVMWLFRPVPSARAIVHSALPVSPADELNAAVSSRVNPTPGGSRTALTWTPDGQALVFVGRRGGVQQLYVRRLDAAEARPIPNTEGAQVPTVSPDGRWVAFWADGAFKKVPIAGGPAVDLQSGLGAPPFGLVWETRRGLLFGWPYDGIWAISPEGKPTRVTTLGAGEAAHTLPSLLPGGRVLLYTVRKRQWSWGDEEVVALILASGERKVVLADATDARYVPSTGHLVFLRRGVLYAVPFAEERLERLGPEVPVLDRVAQALTAPSSDNVTGAGQFAVALDGTLAWIPSSVVPFGLRRLVTVDRRGQVTALPGPVRSYAPILRLSPDQRQLAVVVRDLTEMSPWLYDLWRPAPLRRLTTGGEVNSLVWRPDGLALVFSLLENGRWTLVTQPADGTASMRAPMSGMVWPMSIAGDGRLVALAHNANAADYWDIVTVTVESGTACIEPLIRTPHTEQWPEFSPDGHWVLYGSNATGRDEIYVRPYPGPGREETVSVDGGGSPAWHPSGREVFFVGQGDAAGMRGLMAAEFAPGTPPTIGRPKVLFRFDPRELGMYCEAYRCFDVAADGQRFYAVQYVTSPPAPVVTHVNLIQDWSQELKTKVPTGR
jgi:eukaryotic-like serine/threonine-protein kinase